MSVTFAGRPALIVDDNHPDQVAYRLDAKAALDKMIVIERTGYKAEDAAAFMNECCGILMAALDYAELYGKPLRFDHEKEERDNGVMNSRRFVAVEEI